MDAGTGAGIGAGVGGTDVGGGDIAFTRNYTRLCPEAFAGEGQEAKRAAGHRSVSQNCS